MKKGTFRERMTGFVNELVNPMSYYDWVNQNTTIGGAPFTCDRYPFQKDILNDMSLELQCIKPSQIGLALGLNTPIPTPTGWTTMGDVRVGDVIYAPDGTETHVTFKSEIYLKHKCYSVTFSDGTSIIADENHRWLVESQYSFRLKEMKKTGTYFSGILNTGKLFEHQKHNGRNSFRIKNTEPLKLKPQSLEVDPYLFGLWLGNGNSHTGHITTNQKDVLEITNNLKLKGYAVKEKASEQYSTLAVYTLEGETLISKIKSMGIIKGNKNIPEKYLWGSEDQRINLVQGLLDSDGNIEKNGNCVFSNTNNEIVEALTHLLNSLGVVVNVQKQAPKKATRKDGVVIQGKKEVYILRFTAYSNKPVVKLSRKLERLKAENITGGYANYRKIVSISEVDSVPVQCLTVDHPEHLFLCSKSMIATHNTEVQLRKALAFTARNPHRNLIYTMPDENMRKRVFQNRVLPLLTEDSVFHGLNAAGKKPIRSIEMTEINSSFMMMFPANEKAATSQPADVIFNDEVDLSDPQILALFNSRVQGSDLRMIHNYSTPTYDGLGISALFEVSDQCEYMFKCPHCGQYQIPQYNTKYIRIPNLPAEAPDDLTKFDPIWIDKYKINPLDAYSVCEKCDKRVTYGDDQNHKWVPRHPHRTNNRGYRVSPFSTRQLDAKYILGQFLKYHLLDNMKGFHNTVLGLTHESSDERLSEALLRTLFTLDTDYITESSADPYFIGIDMGKVCHITVGRGASLGKILTVHMETVKVEELPARIVFLKSMYNIVGGFIDRLPLITDSNKVRDNSDYKIMPMQYGRNSGGAMLIGKTDEYGALDYVEAHRTLHLDKFANAIRSGYIRIGGYGTQKETIITHLRAMVRIFEEDKEGVEKVPVWKKKDRNDHYFHSMAYMYQAAVQYFDGYSYLDTQDYNSSIILTGMDNFLVPQRSLF